MSFSTPGSSGSLVTGSSWKLQEGDGGVGEAVGCLVAVVVVVIVSGSLGLRSSIVAFGCVAYDRMDQWFEVDSGK